MKSTLKSQTLNPLDEHLRTSEYVSRQFNKAGYLVAKNVFSEDEIRKILTFFDQVADSRKNRPGGPYAPLARVQQSHPDLIENLRTPGFLNYVRAILGDSISLLESQIMFRPPGSPGTECHQDNWFNKIRPSNGMLTCWIALERTQVQNGCLYVYPKSHNEHLLAVKRHYGTLIKKTPGLVYNWFRTRTDEGLKKFGNLRALVNHVTTIVPQKYKKLPVPMELGSVCFIHGYTAHGSFPNTTKTQFRRSLSNVFIQTDAKVKYRFTSQNYKVRFPNNS